MLLRNTGEEAGHVHEGDDGDVEGVTESDPAGRLHRRVNVEDT